MAQTLKNSRPSNQLETVSYLELYIPKLFLTPTWFSLHYLGTTLQMTTLFTPVCYTFDTGVRLPTI